jgi:C-terminal processing protease CtpA/Prc
VQKADQDQSKEEFNIALLRFVARFKDAHLAVAVPEAYFRQQTEGGLGMVLGQADDSTVIAQIVLENLPAAQAGIKTGARILAWNGQAIDTALASTALLFAPQSSPHATRLQQLRYLMRGPIGTQFSVQFQNPGDAPRTVEVTTVSDSQSFRLSSFNVGRRPDEMPIQMRLLDSGTGYIKINTFRGDSILLTRTWEWAVNKLKALGAPALIVDMRQNGGGSALLARYFAGSFYKDTFILDRAFQSDGSGQFIYVGKDDVLAAPVQWEKPVAVLIGPACASACEIFAAALAHDPQHLLVGRYPTAGVEAGVEPWTLPDNLTFQAPTLREQSPDGYVFVEGVGVVPNLKVPVTVASLVYTQVDELAVADQALASPDRPNAGHGDPHSPCHARGDGATNRHSAGHGVPERPDLDPSPAYQSATVDGQWLALLTRVAHPVRPPHSWSSQ